VPAGALLVAAVLLGGFGACGDGGGGGDSRRDSPKVATGRYGQVHTGICAAAKASAAGDDAAARDAFIDVHAGLHDLAAAAEPEDRAVAARLLEAKQRVEADGKTSDLEELADDVAAAIEVTGGTAPKRCP
jgi:hypothetical protein